MEQLQALQLLLQTTCPDNTILLDDQGNPSVMVRVPKFCICDVIAGGSEAVHPAFLVQGREVAEIYLSKYQNVLRNGRGVSLPGEDPAGEMTYDEAIGYCESKGPGWHLMTNAEWAALALWCRRNGFMPSGNNAAGKDADEQLVSALPASYDEAGAVAHTRTGSGPLCWSHNGQINGIRDLNGNLCEFIGGVRTVYGELQLIPDNDAAAGLDQGVNSREWRALLPDGSFVDPGTAGTLKLDYRKDLALENIVLSRVPSGGRWTYSVALSAQEDQPYYCPFHELRWDAPGVPPELLRALALYPADRGYHGDDCVFFNNGAAEKIINRGGAQHGKRAGGVFFCSGNGLRDRISPAIGFRAAYIPTP